MQIDHAVINEISNENESVPQRRRARPLSIAGWKKAAAKRVRKKNTLNTLKTEVGSVAIRRCVG